MHFALQDHIEGKKMRVSSTCRPISELLAILIPRAELLSTFFGAADHCKDYGEITEEERQLCYHALQRGFVDQGRSGAAFSAKKETVKRLIKEAKKNESLPARF